MAYCLSLFRDTKDPRGSIVFRFRRFEHLADAVDHASFYFQGPQLPWQVEEKDGVVLSYSLGLLGEKQHWNYGAWTSPEGIVTVSIDLANDSERPEEGPSQEHALPPGHVRVSQILKGKLWFCWNGIIWGKFDDWFPVGGDAIEDRGVNGSDFTKWPGFKKAKADTEAGIQQGDIFYTTGAINNKSGIFGTTAECERWEFLWRDASPFIRTPFRG